VSADGWDLDLVPDQAGRTAKPEPTCPVEVALTAIAGRWTTLLLRDLMGGPRSFGEIRAALPTLSDKVLVDRLRELQSRGLVERRVHTGFPTRTTYALTPAGIQLRPLLVQLYETGQVLLAASERGGQGCRGRVAGPGAANGPEV
jgi:DNA-binding HxlR family transcriptional regulator